MTRKPGRGLTNEERILWNRVAVTATPLKGRRDATVLAGEDELEAEKAPPPPPKFRKPQTGASGPATPPERPKPPSGPPAPRELDRPTHAKIARERISIEASVDLHGMTQAEAHALLLRFLHQAHAGGLRHVLVVTGKGGSPGSEGVLKRAVPEWLATQPFRPLVSGHGTAARHHGGGGALYIRLRRKKP